MQFSSLYSQIPLMIFLGLPTHLKLYWIVGRVLCIINNYFLKIDFFFFRLFSAFIWLVIIFVTCWSLVMLRFMPLSYCFVGNFLLLLLGLFNYCMGSMCSLFRCFLGLLQNYKLWRAHPMLTICLSSVLRTCRATWKSYITGRTLYAFD